MALHSTENVYLGAFLRLEGAELKGVRVSRSNGKATAVFDLESPLIQELADRFWSGAVTVNLAAYRQELELLKDELFDALRRNTTRDERRTDDAYPRVRAHARR